MKEDDAKLLICPFSMSQSYPERCKASGCMAWKSSGTKRVFVTLHDKPEEEWFWDPKNSKTEKIKNIRYEPNPEGYCKLIERDE